MKKLRLTSQQKENWINHILEEKNVSCTVSKRSKRTVQDIPGGEVVMRFSEEAVFDAVKEKLRVDDDSPFEIEYAIKIRRKKLPKCSSG